MKRETPPAVTKMNDRWAMDFMSDALSDGRQPRVLTVVDMYTRECVALDAATSFRGEDVARVLTRAIVERGRPAAIQCDNETDFTSRVFDQWAWMTGVQLLFSRPGKQTDKPRFSRASGESTRRLQARVGQQPNFRLASSLPSTELYPGRR